MSPKILIAAAGIAAIVAGGTAHANDAARFIIENSSGQDIDVIDVQPVDHDCWCGDLLGDRALRSGSRVVITPGAPGCMFDVRVIYHDRGRESFRNVNLCRTERIVFTNSQQSRTG